MENEYCTLTLTDAAKLLKMHPESLRRRAIAGDIPSAKPGKSWVFIEADLVEWLRSQYRGPRQASKGEGVSLCHFHDAGRKVSGGFGLPPPVENEYSRVLGLPIGGKLKSLKRD